MELFALWELSKKANKRIKKLVRKNYLPETEFQTIIHSNELMSRFFLKMLFENLNRINRAKF